MGKGYWILGVLMLVGVGGGYAIRITTSDYLNTYQNQQNTQNNNQQNSQQNSSQDSPNQNSSQNSGSNQSSTNSGSASNHSQAQTVPFNASIPNITSNSTQTNQTRTEEPVLYAYWVERAAQKVKGAGSAENGEGNGTNSTNSSG